jgi:hypothetical protein
LLPVFHPTGGTCPDRYVSYGDLCVAVGATLGLGAQANYSIALATAAVHMAKDTGLAGLSALAGDALQATANTRANALKAIAATHAASVGTPTVNGDHLAADGTAATTLAAVPAASSLPTSITLVNALFAWHQAHAIQSGTHFHNDTAPASNTLTVDPPVTLANVVTDLNDLLTMMTAHFARGVA